MKYAIVESGGKQYKAVEGETIAVDRLPVNAGEELKLERVLLLAEDNQFSVGTPLVSGIEALASVVEHFRGEKVLAFRYSPKKRIRVHRGHRQEYTRLMIESIGKVGETKKKARVEKKVEASATQSDVKEEAEQPKAEKAASTPKSASATSSPKGKKPSAAKSSSVKPAKKS